MIDEGCVLNEEDSKLLEDAKFRVRTPSEPLLDVSSSSQPAQVQKLREVQNDGELGILLEYLVNYNVYFKSIGKGSL